MMVVSLIYSVLALMGKMQEFHRIDHSVLKKINNYIYLSSISNIYSFNIPMNDPLPTEIKTMSYHKFDNKNLNAINLDQECIFLDFIQNIEDPNSLKTPIESLDKKSCVFIQSNDPRLKSYLSRSKPRWFYNVSTTDLQKGIFLASIGLESLAPLKGDFVLLDLINAPISKRLLAEIERREIIIFLTAPKNSF